MGTRNDLAFSSQQVQEVGLALTPFWLVNGNKWYTREAPTAPWRRSTKWMFLAVMIRTLDEVYPGRHPRLHYEMAYNMIKEHLWGEEEDIKEGI